MGAPLVGKWFVRTRGRALGIYSAARSLAGIVVPVVAHLALYLIDAGIEATAAASVVSLIALVSVFGRYGSGWLGDLVNKKWLLFGLFFLQPIGTLSLMGVH